MQLVRNLSFNFWVSCGWGRLHNSLSLNVDSRCHWRHTCEWLCWNVERRYVWYSTIKISTKKGGHLLRCLVVIFTSILWRKIGCCAIGVKFDLTKLLNYNDFRIIEISIVRKYNVSFKLLNLLSKQRRWTFRVISSIAFLIYICSFYWKRQNFKKWRKFHDYWLIHILICFARI